MTLLFVLVILEGTQIYDESIEYGSIDKCNWYAEKINKLIVVTGKGIHSDNEKNPYVSKDLSILKYSIPEFITNNKRLMEMIYDIQDAKIEDGGSGAFYINLKKNKFTK